MIAFIKFWCWLIAGFYILVCLYSLATLPKQGKIEMTGGEIYMLNPAGALISGVVKVAVCASAIYFL